MVCGGSAAGPRRRAAPFLPGRVGAKIGVFRLTTGKGIMWEQWGAIRARIRKLQERAESLRGYL